MNEAQNWSVHYLQNGDPQVERTQEQHQQKFAVKPAGGEPMPAPRLLPSLHDALTAACALRQRHKVQYVGGPDGAKYDFDAIVKWCAENVK